jgi:hypothetical protein
MARWRRAAMGGVGLAAIFLAPFACRSPTEITLDVSHRGDCSALKGVTLDVASDVETAEGRASTAFPTTATDTCTPTAGGGEIGTLVITPGGGGGAAIVVAGLGAPATSCRPPDYAGCVVARRIFSFVDHHGVTLPITIDPACVGVPCDENSTCVDRQCVDAHVDCSSGSVCSPPGLLPDGGTAGVDASPDVAGRDGAPPDGGPTDSGTPDAKPDGSSDGGDSGSSSGECPGGLKCSQFSPPVCAPGEACCFDKGGACGSFTACARVQCCTGTSECTDPSYPWCCFDGTSKILCASKVDCDSWITKGGKYLCGPMGGPTEKCPSTAPSTCNGFYSIGVAGAPTSHACQ